MPRMLIERSTGLIGVGIARVEAPFITPLAAVQARMSYSRVSVPTLSTGVSQVFWSIGRVAPGLMPWQSAQPPLAVDKLKIASPLSARVLFTFHGHCGGPSFLISSSRANRPGKLAELVSR